MALTIGIGASVTIAQRVVTEEMHDRRVALGLGSKDEIKNGAKAKILRAYVKPRDQEVIKIEGPDEDGTEVKVTALSKGFAWVDVIDEISEPAGTDYEIYVVREGAEPEVVPGLVASVSVMTEAVD